MAAQTFRAWLEARGLFALWPQLSAIQRQGYANAFLGTTDADASSIAEVYVAHEMDQDLAELASLYEAPPAEPSRAQEAAPPTPQPFRGGAPAEQPEPTTSAADDDALAFLRQAGVSETEIERARELGWDLRQPTVLQTLLSMQRSKNALLGLDEDTAMATVIVNQQGRRVSFFDLMGPSFSVPIEMTLREAIQRPFEWDAQRIARLQSDLVRAGLLDPTQARQGIYDLATRDGYLIALREASTQNRAVDDLISDYGVVRSSDPFTLESVFRERTGGPLPESVAEQSFVLTEEQAYRQSLADAYFTEWGLPAPAELVADAQRRGLNVHQFRLEQRQDPAWHSSPQAQSERLSINWRLAKEFRRDMRRP